jgi:hypothetical protein
MERCLLCEEASKRYMRRSSVPVALSAIQTAVTAALTVWADRVDWLLGDSNRIPPHFVRLHMLVIELRQIWRGVNAPTFPLNFAGQKRFQILGLSMPEILYLFAVAALWFLVGHFREQYKSEHPRNPVAVAILGWGVILFMLALLQIREAFPWTLGFGLFRPIALVNVLLYAIWSFVLIRFGIKNVRVSFGTPPAGTPS